ncbi:MAG TPA: hypothetical protein PKM88_00920 [bacterium]|nr:hypothetical protein [bacterium]
MVTNRGIITAALIVSVCILLHGLMGMLGTIPLGRNFAQQRSGDADRQAWNEQGDQSRQFDAQRERTDGDDQYEQQRNRRNRNFRSYEQYEQAAGTNNSDGNTYDRQDQRNRRNRHGSSNEQDNTDRSTGTNDAPYRMPREQQQPGDGYLFN